VESIDRRNLIGATDNMTDEQLLDPAFMGGKFTSEGQTYERYFLDNYKGLTDDDWRTLRNVGCYGSMEDHRLFIDSRGGRWSATLTHYEGAHYITYKTIIDGACAEVYGSPIEPKSRQWGARRNATGDHKEILTTIGRDEFSKYGLESLEAAIEFVYETPDKFDAQIAARPLKKACKEAIKSCKREMRAAVKAIRADFNARLAEVNKFNGICK
jgi:hypothetical protein